MSVFERPPIVLPGDPGQPPTNPLSPENLPSGIDARKIGAGAVDNGEFATLNGVKTDTTLQAQLDGKQNALPPNTQTFSSSGTWTKPAGNYQSVRVVVIGGGGGGGSGRRAAASASGGGGGGPGGYSEETFPYALLGATEAVTVGQAGIGGAAVTADDTNGNTGTGSLSTGTSTFGTWLRSIGGSGGAGGTTGSGGGGGPGPGQFTGSSGGGGSPTAGGISSNSNGAPSGGGGGSAGDGIAAGDGGAGGNHGAGGGGGGGSNNGANSGAGGNGGAGLVVVYTY